MAVIANVALTNTFDTWRTRTNVGFTRINQFAINESSLYANTLTSNVAFTAKGTATVTGLLTASGRATVGTNLTVSGNTTLGASGKTMTTTGAWSHTGTQTITTNLTVSGNTTFGAAGKTTSLTGLLAVTGRQTIDNNLTVSGNTTFGGASKTVTIGGASSTLTVGGAGHTTNTTGWFGVAGRATVSTNLFVGGNTVLNGTTTDKSNALSQTLTDQATVTWDMASGRVATVTLGASRTIAAPTNQKVGTYILRVIQGGSGSYTLTWNGNYKWTAQTAPVLSTAVGAVDIITFFSDGTKMYGSYLPDMR
jgi:hypothetical protein